VKGGGGIRYMGQIGTEKFTDFVSNFIEV